MPRCRALPWLFAFAAACSSSDREAAAPPFVPAPPEPLSLLAPLDATLQDPLLLTVAAARPRASYLVDEGYTLTHREDGSLAYVTDTAGDLGLAFEVDGTPVVAAEGWATSLSIVHAASDAIVARLDLSPDLTAELRFVVVSSRVAALEVQVENRGEVRHEVRFVPHLRRCEEGYTGVKSVAGGARLEHFAPADGLTKIVGPGTFVEELTGALVSEDPHATWVGLTDCGASPSEDAQSLLRAKGHPVTASIVGLQLSASIPPQTTFPFRVHRVVVESAEPETWELSLKEARERPLPTLISEGEARLAAMPALSAGVDAAAPTREETWVYRSSFALLDQLMLPAEGKFQHDYYLFSREPTWWFGRLGQHIHESLSMILMAHLDPSAAMDSQRNFLVRVEDDGYVPYNIGPVLEQDVARTASAPLLSYVSWEIYAVTKDRAFLEQAYEAGKKVRSFWQNQRDVDQDGLAEWGGIAVSESLRDLENVIWEQVAPPDEVEAVDLNSMLVMQDLHLAKMADELGETGEAQAFRDGAQARATLINERNWDESTGFYYHVARDSNDFTYEATDDLKRLEISGFLPLWAGIIPNDRLDRVLAHLTDPTRFWRDYGVPGLAADDSFYSPDASRCCRWNGPVWVPWMFLLRRGLVDNGREDLARELTRRTFDGVMPQLRRYHQFRELYNPDDQTRPNDSMPNYCWSAMMALMMLEQAP